MLKLKATVGKRRFNISAKDIETICKRASKIAGFTIKPEKVLTRGIWNVVYKRDLYKRLYKHAR
jgi:hypothetical protein